MPTHRRENLSFCLLLKNHTTGQLHAVRVRRCPPEPSTAAVAPEAPLGPFLAVSSALPALCTRFHSAPDPGGMGGGGRPGLGLVRACLAYTRPPCVPALFYFCFGDGGGFLEIVEIRQDNGTKLTIGPRAPSILYACKRE